MKHLSVLFILLLSSFSKDSLAQETASGEKFGNTLNVGIGLGYFGYIGYNMPVLHLDYEIGLARNLTIAPSISIYQYRHNYYWGNNNYEYRYYSYKETVIPIGAKVSYYFDELLDANPKWDFYLAGTLGFIIRRTVWESNYYGETRIRPGTGYLYLDLHIGTEYHINNKLGIFADLSTGMSTFGLAIHL